MKGGDYRAREANVYRLAQVSVDIIDQCAAQGVPFAREYGGLLANRSFGGAQVSRTFYARGQTGQQLLLGAYQALAGQIAAGKITLYNRSDVLDIVTKDGEAKGIVVRDMLTGEVHAHSAHAVVLATGGYGNVYYLSTNAMASNVTAAWRRHRNCALRQPVLFADPPDLYSGLDEFQSKLTLMWSRCATTAVSGCRATVTSPLRRHPEDDRYYYLEEKYPAFGNLVPNDVASHNAKTVVDEGRGVGPLKNGCTSTLRQPSPATASRRFASATATSSTCTSGSPVKIPTRCRCASTRRSTTRWVASGSTTT